MMLLITVGSGCSKTSEEQQDEVDLSSLVAPQAAAYLIQAQEAFEAQNPGMALALLDSAEQHPGAQHADFLADVNFLRARVQTGMNRDDLAAASYEKVLSLKSNYRGAWLNLGNVAYRQGNYTTALEHYRREQAAYPDAGTLVSMGRAYAELGKVDSARYAYEQAMQTDAKLAEAHIRMAELLEKNGEPEAALRYAKQALELDGNNPDYRYFTGTLLMRTSQPEEAARFFSDVIAHQPNRQEAHYNLGQALVRLGRHDEGQKYLATADSLLKIEREVAQWETMTVIDPQNPAAWATYGYALRQTGREQEALRAYGVALHLDPNHIDVRYELANLFLKQDQFGQAIDQYRSVLRQDSTYAGAWVNLGIAYARSGHTDAARSAWQAALRQQPDNPYAARYLAQLQAN